MALYTRDSIDAVRDAVDIEDLIGSYTRLRGHGMNRYGRCPFHEDSRPSLSVNVVSKLYNCFGCPAQGNAIKFVREIERLGFREAVEFLADRYSVTLQEEDSGLVRQPPRTSRPRTTRAPPLQPPSPEQIATRRQSLVHYVEHCHRRLEDPEGYVARRWLQARGITEKQMRDHKLGYDPGYMVLGRGERAPPSVTLPLLDESGEVVYTQGRLLQPSGEWPKFLNPSSGWIGPSPRLSAIQSPRGVDRRFVVVTEGLCDGMLAGQYFETRAVIGAHQQLDDSIVDRLVAAADGRPLVLCFDADAAGRDGAARLGAHLTGRGGIAASAWLPAEDITDVRLDAGERFEEVFRSVVAEAATRATLDRSALDPLREHGHLLGLQRLELVEGAIRDGSRQSGAAPGNPFERLNADDALETLRIERRQSAVRGLIEADREQIAEHERLAELLGGEAHERHHDSAEVVRELMAVAAAELAELEEAQRDLIRQGRDLDRWLESNLGEVTEWVAHERAARGWEPPELEVVAHGAEAPGYDLGL